MAPKTVPEYARQNTDATHLHLKGRYKTNGLLCGWGFYYVINEGQVVLAVVGKKARATQWSGDLGSMMGKGTLPIESGGPIYFLYAPRPPVNLLAPSST